MVLGSRENASSAHTSTPSVACHLCLDPAQVLVDTVFTQGQQQICFTTALLLTTGKIYYVLFPIHVHIIYYPLARSTCKSFCAPPFTLLIVLYNSVYYNYIIITQWLVGWFGVCVGKKVHLWPRGIFVPFLQRF